MLERQKDTSRDRKTGILKAGLVAAQLFTYEHGPVSAAEISRHATWIQGSAELEKSAREKTIEYGTTFVQYSDGSSEWLPVLDGNWDELARDTPADARTIAKNREQRKVAFVCKIHTHPLRTGRILFNSGKDSDVVPYMPPSGMDISTQNARVDVQDYARAGVQGHTIRYAVFDPQGVWSHRPITYEEQQSDLKRDPERLNKINLIQHANRLFASMRYEINAHISKLPEETLRQVESLLSESSRRIIAETEESARDRQRLQALVFDLTNTAFAPSEELLKVVMPQALRQKLEEVRETVSRARHASRELQQSDRGKFNDAFRNFTRGNFSSTFDFSIEYPRLQEAYRKYENVIIRFTPYQDLKNEPPCAGPDYRPGGK